jgi:uncharacterized protein
MTDKEKSIVKKTEIFVKETLKDAESGHDWWHIYRVYKTAVSIARKENADMFTVSLGALLHDIADPKFHDGDEEKAPAMATEFLKKTGVDNNIIEKVVEIIKYVSFKNRKEAVNRTSKELAVVQDADRLDALGAIGIARTFNYGGYKKRAIYNPEIKPVKNQTKKQYMNSTAPTINHFYEKLLLLKDMMNTETGKKLAEERHRYMEEFLERFFKEWEGEM